MNKNKTDTKKLYFLYRQRKKSSQPNSKTVTSSENIWDTIWQLELDKPKLFSESEFAKKVLAMLKPKQKILSLGPGYGFDELLFAKNGHKIIGLDISQIETNHLNALAIKHSVKSRLKCITGNFLDPFPFKDNQFDVVYANSSLHYFNDSELLKILSEVHRVLKQNGKLYAVCRSIFDWKNNDRFITKRIDSETVIDGRGLQMRFFSMETFLYLFYKSGFQTQKLEYCEIERYDNRENYSEPNSQIIEATAEKNKNKISS